MKRQKQRGVPSPSMNRLPRTMSGDENAQQPIYEAQHQPLKSFSSSPDLQSAFQPPHLRKQSIDSTSDYSKPYRAVRPKTPPPPPPTNPEVLSTNPAPPTQSTVVQNTKPSGIPPPPPPPLPSNFLSNPPQKFSQPSTSTTPAPTPSTANDPSKSDCRGITAQALTNVRLKPVNNANSTPRPTPSVTTTEAPNSASKPPTIKAPLDFDSDLRSALAKRRSKVCSEDDTSEATALKPQTTVNNGAGTTG